MMGKAADWLREERRKTLGDWVAVCLGCGFAQRYFDESEHELPTACPQCGGETAAGAFDDAEDFSRHDLIGLARARRLYFVPIWIDVGRSDPFARADETLARELRQDGEGVNFHLHAGGHSGWAERKPTYLRWYASRLEPGSC